MKLFFFWWVSWFLFVEDRIVVSWSGFLVVVYFLLADFLEECKCSDIKSSHSVKCFGSKITWSYSGKDRFFNFIMEWIRAREFNPQITLPIGSRYGIFTYSWLKFMVRVGKCSIHGFYGLHFIKGNMLNRRACVHPYHPWSGKIFIYIYIQRYTETCLKSRISSISQCLPLSLSLYIYIFDYIEPRDPVVYVGPWQVGAGEAPRIFSAKSLPNDQLNSMK